jgi:LacI family transcriptional regulator
MSDFVAHINAHPPRKTATMQDVARAVGVTPMTVSYALSGKRKISNETREAILQAARELNFEPNMMAQRLRKGRCEKTIGFFSLDVDLSSRTRQLQIIQAELSDLGYTVPVYAYGYRGRDVVANQLELINTLISQRPRAIICNTSGVLPPVLERLQNFVDEGGIAVCYGFSLFADVDCDQVVYAEGETFYDATKHLLDLGHRDIGFFNVGYRKPGGEMMRHVERAMQEVGATIREEWLFPNDGTLTYEEHGELLGKMFLEQRKRPTGMVMANDYAAVAFMATLVQNGVRIPQDVSVVGHNNDSIAPFGVVPLTTTANPIAEVADAVIDLLQSRIVEDYQGEPRRITVPGTSIIRQSTAAFQSS